MSSKTERRRRFVALQKCKRITGERGQKRLVFQAVAWRLGVEWNETVDHGYALCHQLAREEVAPPLHSPKVRRLVPPSLSRIDVATPDLDFARSDEFLRSYPWRVLRMRVLTKYGGRCQACGATAQDGVRIQVDHIKPRRDYPALALVESNLQVLCEDCNHGKSNWDTTDWRPAVKP